MATESIAAAGIRSTKNKIHTTEKTTLSSSSTREKTRKNSTHISSKFKVQSSKFKVQGSKFKVQSSKFKVQSCSKFKVQGSKFKVQSSGSGVSITLNFEL